MKGISVIQDEKFKDYISMILEVGYEFELNQTLLEKEINTLLVDGEHNFVFCEYSEESELSTTIFEKIKKEELNVSFILIGEATLADIPKFKSMKEQNTLCDYIPKDFKDADFFEILEACLEKQGIFAAGEDNCKKPIEKKEMADDEFVKVKISRMMFFKHRSPCDIFVSVGPQKKIKIATEGAPLKDGLVDKYFQKGIIFLDVMYGGYKKMLEGYQESIKGLKKMKTVSSLHKTMRDAFILDLVMERTKALGMSQNHIDEVDDINKSTIDVLKKNINFKDVINKLLKEENFISAHSLFTSYIAIEICKLVEWNDKATFEKISFACLMHDCLFKDVKLAKIQTKSEMIDLTDEEKKEVIEHPLKTAENIMKFNIPMIDVEKIILEHHERPDGSGFPKGTIGTMISPLGCLFIMSEDFALSIFEKEITVELLLEVKDNFFANYKRGNFRRFIEAFETLFKRIGESYDIEM
jgi:hypothetical protein